MMKNFPDWNFENNSWQEKTLGEIAESFTYGMNAKAVAFDGVHKYLRITDIDEDSRRFTQENLTSPNCECDENFLAQEGDIFFARTASVGRTYVYKKTDGEVYHAGYLIRVRIKKNFVPYFIFLQTLTTNYKNWVKRMAGGTAQLGINVEGYKTLKIKFPCVEEQKKIANYFLELDNAIEAQEKKLLSWRELKRGLLQKIFSQEFRFIDEQGNFYPDWIEKTLGEFFPKISAGKTKRNDNGKFLLHGSTGIIGKCDSAEYVGDKILIARVGSVGRLNYVTKACGVTDNTLIIENSCDKINFKWLYYFLANAHLDKLGFGTAQFLIKSSQLKELILKVPCMEEQKKIADYFTELDKIISAEKEILENMRLMKKGLLQKLFPSSD